jgi:hypothetical protein
MATAWGGGITGRGVAARYQIWQLQGHTRCDRQRAWEEAEADIIDDTGHERDATCDIWNTWR